MTQSTVYVVSINKQESFGNYVAAKRNGLYKTLNFKLQKIDNKFLSYKNNYSLLNIINQV